MKLNSVFLALALSASLPATADIVKWVTTSGGAGSDATISVTTDASGNVISTGVFTGTVDFDPGSGTMNLSSQGDSDVFIQKLDAQGHLLWAKSIGGTDRENAKRVLTDAAGNIYVMGKFIGTVDFDPGTAVNNLTSQTVESIFILKLDASGNHMLAFKRDNTVNTDMFVQNADFAMDNSNNYYLVYSFGHLNSGFGPITATVGVVEKASSTGTQVWFQTYSSSNYLTDQSITLAASGEVVVAGTFKGGVQWDADASFGAASSNECTYIIKLTSAGVPVFLEQVQPWSSSCYNWCYDVKTDATGNVYVCGNFIGDADFDPDITNTHLENSVTAAMYLLKLSPAGTFIWVHTFTTGVSSWMTALALDAGGNIYATGRFFGTLEFQSTAPIVKFTASVGGTDAFVMKLDDAGTYQWARVISGPSADLGVDIALSPTSDVYACGSFTGATDFDAFNGTHISATAAGDADGFVYKINDCPLIDTSVTASGNTLTANETGTYQWVDCATFQLVTGATGKTFTPAANGSYAVIINKNGCINSSSCHAVTGVGVKDVNRILTSVYPNPTTGDVQIQLSQVYSNVMVKIISAIGQIQSVKEYHNTQNITTAINGADGLYYVQLVIDGKETAQAVVNKRG